MWARLIATITAAGSPRHRWAWPELDLRIFITLIPRAPASLVLVLVGVIVIGIIKREDGWSWVVLGAWVAKMGGLRVNLEIFGVVGFTSHLPASSLAITTTTTAATTYYYGSHCCNPASVRVSRFSELPSSLSVF